MSMMLPSPVQSSETAILAFDAVARSTLQLPKNKAKLGMCLPLFLQAQLSDLGRPPKAIVGYGHCDS